MYMYMYVFVYVYVYIYIDIDIYLYIHICIYIYEMFIYQESPFTMRTHVVRRSSMRTNNITCSRSTSTSMLPGIN
jgi:hypothetical protein